MIKTSKKSIKTNKLYKSFEGKLWWSESPPSFGYLVLPKLCCLSISPSLEHAWPWLGPTQKKQAKQALNALEDLPLIGRKPASLPVSPAMCFVCCSLAFSRAVGRPDLTVVPPPSRCSPVADAKRKSHGVTTWRHLAQRAKVSLSESFTVIYSENYEYVWIWGTISSSSLFSPK